MSDTEGEYEGGYGKPPAGRHFLKGQSGNPRGKNLPIDGRAFLNRSRCDKLPRQDG